MPDTSNVAATVASAVPVVGNILSAALSVVGIKGSTAHVSWDAANTFGEQQGAAIENQIQTKYPSQFPQITDAFYNNMIAYLSTVSRWGDGNPQNKAQIIAGLKAHAGLYTNHSIGGVFWNWNMWAMQNCDSTSTTDYAGVFNQDMNATLLLAIQQVTGLQVTHQNLTTGNVASVISSAPTTPSTQVASGSSSAAALTGSISGVVSTATASITSNPIMLLLLVGIGVSVFVFRKKL